VLDPGLTADGEAVCVRPSDGDRPRAKRKRYGHVGPAAYAGVENHRRGPGSVDDTGQAVQGRQAPVRLTAAMVGAPQAVHSAVDRAARVVWRADALEQQRQRRE
jgi:hypothetical protein